MPTDESVCRFLLETVLQKDFSSRGIKTAISISTIPFVPIGENMIAATSLSSESISLLKTRGLSDQQVNNFSDLLDKAHSQQADQKSAKTILTDMSTDELQLLQKATSLANPIQISSLSKEGSMNLLAQPDKTGMVDLNNDGLVEVGAAKMITFPPVNSPEHVKEAWNKSTENMDEKDKLLLEFRLHTQTYGVMINDQPTKVALPPEQQWSPENIKKWLAEGRATNEFNAKYSGWTQANLAQKDFYNRFETALAA